MPEISDQELAVLRESQNVLLKLNGDPKSRSHLEAGLKIHYPAVETEAEVGQRLAAPVLEGFKKEVIEPLTEQLKTLNDRQSADAAARAANETAEAFARLTKAGYTADGIEKIKQLMVDRSIPDVDAAAALFDRQNPEPKAPIETAWTPPGWDVASVGGSGIDVKALFQDETRWADQEAASVLNEIRVGQAA